MVKTDLIRTREAVGEREASVDGSRGQLVANIIIIIRILEVREQKVRPGCGSVEKRVLIFFSRNAKCVTIKKDQRKQKAGRLKKNRTDLQ